MVRPGRNQSGVDATGSLPASRRRSCPTSVYTSSVRMRERLAIQVHEHRGGVEILNRHISAPLAQLDARVAVQRDKLIREVDPPGARAPPRWLVICAAVAGVRSALAGRCESAPAARRSHASGAYARICGAHSRPPGDARAQACWLNSQRGFSLPGTRSSCRTARRAGLRVDVSCPAQKCLVALRGVMLTTAGAGPHIPVLPMYHTRRPEPATGFTCSPYANTAFWHGPLTV